MSVRRRIGWAAAAIFGPLLLAAMAAPYLVDVEAYKPALTLAVKEATGRELVIEGPMRLSLLPVPQVVPSGFISPMPSVPRAPR